MKTPIEQFFSKINRCFANRNSERGFSLPEAMIAATIAIVAGYITSKGLVQFNQSMAAKSAKSDSNRQIGQFISGVKTEFSKHVSQLYPGEAAGRDLFNILRNVPFSAGQRSGWTGFTIRPYDPGLSADKLSIYRNRKFVIEQETLDPNTGAASITRTEYEAVCSYRTKSKPTIALLQSKSWQKALDNQAANGCIPADYCNWENEILVIRKDTWLNWNNANDDNINTYPTAPSSTQCFPNSHYISQWGSATPRRCNLNAKELQSKTIGMSFCAWTPSAADAANLYLRVWAYQLGPGNEILHTTRDASFTRNYSLNNMNFINE